MADHFLCSGCSTVGSAPRSGRGGRKFESSHPDKFKLILAKSCLTFSEYQFYFTLKLNKFSDLATILQECNNVKFKNAGLCVPYKFPLLTLHL